MHLILKLKVSVVDLIKVQFGYRYVQFCYKVQRLLAKLNMMHGTQTELSDITITQIFFHTPIPMPTVRTKLTSSLAKYQKRAWLLLYILISQSGISQKSYFIHARKIQEQKLEKSTHYSYLITGNTVVTFRVNRCIRVIPVDQIQCGNKIQSGKELHDLN